MIFIWLPLLFVLSSFQVFAGDVIVTVDRFSQNNDAPVRFSICGVGTTCLLQVATGMLLDSRVEKGLFRHYFWMIWYPLAFWLINVFTTVVGVPRALLRSRGERARWKSPDRGLLPDR